MAIHPTSEVHSVNIGVGTSVWQHCIILKGAIIGNECSINYNVFIENDVRIGDNVTIKPGVQLWDGITVGDDVFIGPNVTFTNDLIPRPRAHSFDWKDNTKRWARTNINKGASIGANATIVAGITIGEYALIGAGSVVTKNIPPHTLWYGNPAKHHGYITKDGIILDKNMRSKEGEEYIYKDNLFIIK
jgi:UDP-2-acetamido-3-amino-2,3-dideoxy-glucuronate N-acetyltransferase